MTSKEALAATTVFSRNHVVWFMLFWALAMFIIDGIVFSTDPPPGENRWEYGPSVFLVCLIVAVGWGIVSVRKTEAAHAAELKRLRETKTLAELMSLNMGA